MALPGWLGKSLTGAAERVRPVVQAGAQRGRRVSGAVAGGRTAGRSSGARGVMGPYDRSARVGATGHGWRGGPRVTNVSRPQLALPAAGQTGRGRTPGWNQRPSPMPTSPYPQGPVPGQRALPAANGWKPGTKTSSGRKGFVRRHPGAVMGAGALGLAGMSLSRNTGPGVSGNGYLPPGSSTGGQGF